MESSEDDNNMKCSEKKMELGDYEGVWTVESLRGRLLAERQASRTAKEDAERMGNKLKELEKTIKEEIRLRNKAEKKLKFLKKKLEALNISSSHILVDFSEQSSSSEEVSSCRSSSTNNSTNNELLFSLQENMDSDSQVPTNSVNKLLESGDDNNLSEKSITEEIHEKCPLHNVQDISTGQGTTTSSISSSNSPEDFLDNPTCKSESSKSDDHNSSAELIKSSSAEHNESDSDQEEDLLDNSLALVPVSLPESVTELTKTSKEVKPVHENVAQVLDSLKYIKENIQRSMEIRRMVRVGPA